MDCAPPSESAPADIAFTDEQLVAVEQREGDLLLDAGAGSGKTAVLVERFVRAVREDGVDVGRILAITFTEKAAAELRDRIRERLRELGDDERARATEGAWISTIDGFCARVLRASALAAAIDPAFVVLDETEAGRLAELAFERALEAAALDPGAIDLIAGYRVARLRRAIVAVHGELRSRGELAPVLPPAAPVAASAFAAARAELATARDAAAAELAGLLTAGQGNGSLADARARLARAAAVLAASDPWLGDIDAARLRNGSAAVLSGEACGHYRDALDAFRALCARREAVRAHGLLDRLLRQYGAIYAELKRERSALDFEDLELMTRDLLTGHGELRRRYAERFEQIMVDELQDTNPVQLELIESIARENLFTVGDAFQSIYGFRHADVELFEQRRERLTQSGARATLSANFRSRPELLDALNLAFAPTFGERFTPLRAGRGAAPAALGTGAGTEGPTVELMIVDKAADWGPSAGEISAAWRLAEARALAGRVRRLVDAGAAPRDIVLLARAATDLRAYERALEHQGMPTYVIGGRGYWSHPQVLDFVAYLRALANPRDGEALYTVLASPLVGASPAALVVLAAAARESGRDPWWVLREPEALLDDLDERDRERLARFARWFWAERERAARTSIDGLIERALELTGYDLTMLAMPGGERRLANVRKLMRLGGEHETRHGRDLRAFLDLVRGLQTGRLSESRESEAPVEGEALDAVRLMTIHRAKGLEFEIVCVADLGRTPRGSGGDVVRVGRAGRLGLKVARAGRGRLIPVLDYDTVGVDRDAAEEREERRLYYVAATRARERLILSGAIGVDPWPERRRGGAPLAWIAPAFVPDLAARAAAGELTGVVERSELEWAARVAYTIVRPGGAENTGRELDVAGVVEARATAPAPALAPAPAVVPAPLLLLPPPAPPVSSLSYSSLGEYARCGYRFYLERVLGLPRVETGSRAEDAKPGISAADRGVLVHALLETLDLRRGQAPTAAEAAAAAARAGVEAAPGELDEAVTMVTGFLDTDLRRRLAGATDVRREEPFAFLLEPAGVVVSGFLDVVAREGARLIVVDYKSDRLDGAEPAAVVAESYRVQRLVYALAVLEVGAPEVEVVHTFLEAPERPVKAFYSSSDSEGLERELAGLAGGVLGREFPVSPVPHRALCRGCPGEGGLCSWPLELTRRERVDTLF